MIALDGFDDSGEPDGTFKRTSAFTRGSPGQAEPLCQHCPSGPDFLNSRRQIDHPTGLAREMGLDQAQDSKELRPSAFYLFQLSVPLVCISMQAMLHTHNAAKVFVRLDRPLGGDRRSARDVSHGVV